MNTRRPDLRIVFIPKVEFRASGVGRNLPFACRLLPSPLRPQSGRKNAGMTMIELGLVMGIVSVLLALVLGLGRHVNATVKIRRAQADLGVWHEALNRWHLQFGDYPYESVDLATGKAVGGSLLNDSDPSLNLSNVLASCHLQFTVSNTKTNIAFRSFQPSSVKHIDPWGFPYIYTCDPSRKAYTLYSCGADSRSMLNGKGIPPGTPPNPDPTLDDIYFER